MKFTDAHSNSAVCTPTRYGTLTGRYAWRTGLQNGVLWGYDTMLIKNNRTTLASLSKRSGYRTACIGKWHLELDWKENTIIVFTSDNGCSPSAGFAELSAAGHHSGYVYRGAKPIYLRADIAYLLLLSGPQRSKPDRKQRQPYVSQVLWQPLQICFSNR